MQPYLTEEFSAKLDKFTLRSRMIVEGFMIGLHKSPYHGFSVEFADHRQYHPGDSLRNMDWKVLARTNRYYIKRYEEETNLRCYILIDHSRSMGFQSGGVTKLEYAKALASSLAYLMIRQQDAAGIITFGETITGHIPPKSYKSYLGILNQHLFQLQSEAMTNTAAVFHTIAEQIKKRSLIVIISDLLDDPENITSGLRHFRHQKHEVVLFHIQDPQEKEFRYNADIEFIDAETGEKLRVNPWQIRNPYLKQLQSFTDAIKQEAHTAQIDYQLINTETPIEQMLLSYLIKRSKL